MARYREEVCKYYVCEGKCEKDRTANFKGYCQRCTKYESRCKVKHFNKKREYNEKLIKNDF